MMATNESFLSVVARSETLAARLDTLVNHVIENANSHFGVVLSKADVVSLPEVRVATLSGGDLDESAWLKEATQLESVIAARHRKSVEEALARGEHESQEEYRGLSRAQRLTLARTRGHTGAVTAKAKPSATEEAIMLRKIASIRSPQERINLARKWGLV